MNNLRRHRQRASALVMILAMMFILLIIVVGMHWRQASARASLLHEEANLEARIASEYEIAKQIYPAASFSPIGQTVKASVAANLPLGFAPGLAKPLFQDAGLANMLKPQNLPKTAANLLARPGKSWNLISPSSLDPSMQPDKVKILSVVANDFAFVACAPAGKITASLIQPWSNELFSLKYSPDTAMNGAPARIAAKSDIKVDKLTHGEAWSEGGNIDIADGVWNGFAGIPPELSTPQAYTRSIESQITTAIQKLSDAAQDKTNLANGNILSVDTIVSLFTGKVDDFLGKALSMRQAMQFPFFMIPSFRVSGIVVTIWLHMPFPADGDDAQNSMDKLGKEQGKERDDKQKDLNDQHDKVVELEKEVAGASDDDERKDKQKKLDEAKEREKDLGKELQELATKFGDQTKAALGSAKMKSEDGWATRADEPSGKDNGDPLFSYVASYKWIFQLIIDALGMFADMIAGNSPDFTSLLNDLYKQVRLVHFGGKENETTFAISDTLTEMTATFDVPPGRAIKLSTNVTINGDLWLMRGSTLVVTGDLKVQDPGGSSVDPRKPRGRVFLEEGAKLVVHGNFNCQGSPLLGSVLVGAPIRAIHPTTSAILVKGNVEIPYGVWPAFSLGDLDLEEIKELKQFREIVSTVVPNLAKLAGPFHRRKAYFSQKATEYVLAMVPTPIGIIPVLVPAPIPERNNINVSLFKAMALIYSTQMNLAWGENFITHTDWWLIGQGFVPMFPKINPTVYIDKIKNFDFHLPDFPSPDNVKKLIETQGPKMVKEMAPKLLAEVITKLVIDQLSMGLGSLIADNLPLEDWINQVLGVEDSQKSLSEIVGLSSLAEEIKAKANENAALMLMQETPGAFIYSGGKINIGGGPVSIGMLVAKGDVVSQASYNIGAVMSLNGNVEVKRLLFDANCTRCSMFLPQVNPTEVIPGLTWFNWAVEYRYGRLLDLGDPVDVAPNYQYSSVHGGTQ
ncbi:MAG: OmpH family outer membrane protein [Vulcanimicrobiota bacterium]